MFVTIPANTPPEGVWNFWRRRLLAAPMLGVLLGGPSGAAATANKIDFSFQIQPLLAERCFKCHGPDEKARKAKLRLDAPEQGRHPRPDVSRVQERD